MSPSASVHVVPISFVKTARATNAPAPTDPGRWVDDHGDYLFSYAMFRLRDPVKSQDAVQETFLAALKSAGSFAGKTGERGWLLGILKHKIHDTFRKSSRETSFTDLGFYEEEERERFAATGIHKDAWIHALGPKDWPDAGESLDREEFWRTFRSCASKLPKNIARAFLMRELDGLESRNICEILNISENNLWVMLHRARMALRNCLETNWFKSKKSASSKSND